MVPGKMYIRRKSGRLLCLTNIIHTLKNNANSVIVSSYLEATRTNEPRTLIIHHEIGPLHVVS